MGSIDDEDSPIHFPTKAPRSVISASETDSHRFDFPRLGQRAHDHGAADTLYLLSPHLAERDLGCREDGPSHDSIAHQEGLGDRSQDPIGLPRLTNNPDSLPDSLKESFRVYIAHRERSGDDQ
jgi:hypothetical protein